MEFTSGKFLFAHLQVNYNFALVLSQSIYVVFYVDQDHRGCHISEQERVILHLAHASGSSLLH